MRLRPADAGDCEALWRWRNDPETRRASFDEREVPLDVHARWFEGVLGDADRRLYVIEVEAAAVGMVRLDLQGRAAVVSINLAPEWRGKGLGLEALRRLGREAFDVLGLERLIARVKGQNLASLATFERAGYRPRPSGAAGPTVELVCERPAAGARP
ncbi:MAG: hypothetical protein A2X36_05095 [Elusimicrobia bacterium GWA2_69_24]|nr:MAG: hypothetical protein A2X36_05095 [Elusimicrobia bacterium GWA2_69_24]